MEIRNNGGAMMAEQWEGRLGKQIRDLRLRQNLTQADLARLANIDRTTVVRIERGEGGSINSLVQLARALGREDWLSEFAPPEPGVSPMQMLRDRQHKDARQRVRARPSERTR